MGFGLFAVEISSAECGVSHGADGFIPSLKLWHRAGEGRVCYFSTVGDSISSEGWALKWRPQHLFDLVLSPLALEPLVGAVKEQEGYIKILEGQNDTLREEHEALSRLSAGMPVPFVKAGHLLARMRVSKKGS